MKDLILQDIELYEYTTVGVAKTDMATNSQYADIDFKKKCFRVYGTQEQINKFKKDLPIDEVYDICLEKAGSYWDGICFNNGKKTLKEYNQEIEKIHNTYYERYLNNNKQIVIR